MKLIDKRLYEGREQELISSCTACKITIRKGREREFRWERCRVVGKDWGSTIGVDEDIMWYCPRCITEFVDKNDEETKTQLEKEKEKYPLMGRPKGTGNGGSIANKDKKNKAKKK